MRSTKSSNRRDVRAVRSRGRFLTYVIFLVTISLLSIAVYWVRRHG